MSITTDLNTINENREQAEIALKYLKSFQQLLRTHTLLDDQLKIVAADTKFNLIPTDVKQALNSYWQLIKSFKNAVEADPEIYELMQWHK